MGIVQNSSASSFYAEVGRRSQIEGASPHKLIELLLQNAVNNINTAKDCFDNENIEQRGKCLSKATEIVSYLRVSLDLEKGGEIAVNLHNLYFYVEEQLVSAHIDENPSGLDHVTSILTDLLDTWVQIRDEV